MENRGVERKKNSKIEKNLTEKEKKKGGLEQKRERLVDQKKNSKGGIEKKNCGKGGEMLLGRES